MVAWYFSIPAPSSSSNRSPVWSRHTFLFIFVYKSLYASLYAPRGRVTPKPQCPMGSGLWFQARQPDAAGGRSEGKQGVWPGMTPVPPPGGGRQLQVLL